MCFGQQAYAQHISYESVDSLNTAISNLQSTAENTIYFDGVDEYTLSFPEQNFGLLLHSMAAYHSVYQQWDGGMSLAVTENIDLTKATNITYKSSPLKATVIRLYFPPGYLKTQYFEDGRVTNTVSQEFLPFYCSADPQNIGSLYASILRLYFSLKIAKGEYTQAEVETMGNAFSKTVNEHSKEAYASFLQLYPNSIWVKEAHDKMREFKEAENKHVEQK